MKKGLPPLLAWFGLIFKQDLIHTTQPNFFYFNVLPSFRRSNTERGIVYASCGDYINSLSKKIFLIQSNSF